MQGQHEAVAATDGQGHNRADSAVVVHAADDALLVVPGAEPYSLTRHPADLCLVLHCMASRTMVLVL